MKLKTTSMMIIVGELFEKFTKRYDETESVYKIGLINLKLEDKYFISLDAKIYCDKDAIAADVYDIVINDVWHDDKNLFNDLQLFEQKLFQDKLNRALKFYINDYYNELQQS